MKTKKKGNNRWCKLCKSNSHDFKFCRNRNKTNNVDCHENKDSTNNYIFNVDDSTCVPENNDNDSCKLLVDCGATVLIVSDKSKFINFYDNFDHKQHIIELADGSQSTDIVAGKGDASFTLTDKFGVKHDIMLKNALYVPSFSQNIFSVCSW